MGITEAKKNANNKYKKKLLRVVFDFNKENQKDVEILEKFEDIAMRFPNKKEAFIHLVENAEE